MAKAKAKKSTAQKPRDIGDVIRRMIDAMPAADGSALVADLRRLASKIAFTAPEAMRGRWAELVEVFNRGVFGDAPWDREKAPEWAKQAGMILAGEL